jgi:hypothetical protein
MITKNEAAGRTKLVAVRVLAIRVSTLITQQGMVRHIREYLFSHKDHDLTTNQKTDSRPPQTSDPVLLRLGKCDGRCWMKTCRVGIKPGIHQHNLCQID